MKPILQLLAAICLVVPARAQTEDSTASEPTVVALTALLPLRDQAKFGLVIKGHQDRTKFAGFLTKQSRFAVLADKETLLRFHAEANRPNYGGNAAARTHNNLWKAVIEGKVAPNPAQPND